MLLLDRNEKIICTLNTETRPIYNDEYDEQLNGPYTLKFTIPGNIEYSEDVKEGNYVIFQDRDGFYQMFEITEVIEYRDMKHEKDVFCDTVLVELNDEPIKDKRPTDTTASLALATALENTRWTPGTVDALGTHSTNFYDTNSMDALGKIINIWGGEVRTRIEVAGKEITGRYIDILASRGSVTGKRVRNSKDMIYIDRTIDNTGLKTAMIGRGKGEELETGGFGRRITFADINGGLDYVEDDNARLLWGRVNSDDTKRHLFGYFEDPDETDPAVLKTKTEEALANASTPLISYTVKFHDFEAFGMDHEKVRLGDTIVVIDDDFNPALEITAKVIRVKRSLTDPNVGEITLGNFLPDITKDRRLDNIESAFNQKVGIWDQSAPEFTGPVPTSWLDGQIDTLTNQLIASGEYQTTEPQENVGLLFENNDVASVSHGAIYIGPNTLAIASNRDAVTGDWNWRSWGSGQGFTADVLTAGTLKGGNVEFNLEEGTLVMGPAGDYDLSYINGNLNIKSGILTIGDISNLQTELTGLQTDVDGKTTPSEVTVITNDTISTTNVLAQNLRVNMANVEGTLTIGDVDNLQTELNGLQTDVDGKTTPTEVTTITNNTIETTNVIAQNLRVNIANVQGTIYIGDVYNLSNELNSKTEPSDVTTITNDTLKTTSVYAQYLYTSAARIQGTLIADALVANTTITSPIISGGRFEADDAGITDYGSLSSSIRIWAGRSYSGRSYAPFRVTKIGGVVMGGNTYNPESGSDVYYYFRGVYIPYQISNSPWDGIINRGGSSLAARWKFDNSTYMLQHSSVWSLYFNGYTRTNIDSSGNIETKGKLNLGYENTTDYGISLYEQSGNRGIYIRKDSGFFDYGVYVVNRSRSAASGYAMRFANEVSWTMMRLDWAGNFSVIGNKNVIQSTPSYGKRLMNALETPDSRFVTYMEMILPIGVHTLPIEPMFAETISEFFIVPHVQFGGEVKLISKAQDSFTVEVIGEESEVVIEVNGRRVGFEDQYMEPFDEDAPDPEGFVEINHPVNITITAGR